MKQLSLFFGFVFFLSLLAGEESGTGPGNGGSSGNGGSGSPCRASARTRKHKYNRKNVPEVEDLMTQNLDNNTITQQVVKSDSDEDITVEDC
jgi:hypothetical protein